MATNGITSIQAFIDRANTGEILPTDAWKTITDILGNNILSLNIGTNISVSFPAIIHTLCSSLASLEYDYSQEHVAIIQRNPLQIAIFNYKPLAGGVPSIDIRLCGKGNRDFLIGITTNTFTIEERAISTRRGCSNRDTPTE